MASESNIKRVLEHLAWLKEQAGEEINQDRARDAALLTWTAAVRLQFHFVMPMGDVDQITNRADREKAAKLIDDFVWAVKTVFEKAEVAKNARPADAEALRLCLTSLQRLLSAILRRLPALFQLEAPIPVRFLDLERTQDYARLLRDWEVNHSRSHLIDRGPLASSLRASDGAGLRRSLAAVLATQDAAAMKACPPHIRRAFRETIAGFVELDAEEAAERSHGTAKKRWLELGKSLAQHLRAAGGSAS